MSLIQFRMAWMRARGLLARWQCVDPSFKVKGRALYVSLKTITKRINSVDITIESLFQQSLKPTGVLLWLPRAEYSDPASIPKRLRRMTGRGLRIRLCDTNRSHDKLLPALAEFPDAVIVTVDDDYIYSKHMLRDLVDAYEATGDVIISHAARLIRFNESGDPTPYLTWTLAHPCLETPSHFVLPVGCFGVLYPPHALDPLVSDLELSSQLCPTTDDLWFKLMAVRANTKAMMVRGRSTEAEEIPTSQEVSLWDVNKNGGNDAQWASALAHFRMTAKDFA